MLPERGVGQDDIYTVHGRVNYILAKVYRRHNLLYFMQKTMQKVASNIRDETVGHVACFENNHAIYQGSPQKLQCIL
jgi:hypothetical protein